MVSWYTGAEISGTQIGILLYKSKLLHLFHL